MPQRKRTLDDALAQFEPEPNSGYWIWLGTRDCDGYGVARIKQKACRAHRVIYEALVGVIGEDTLNHLCRVRACVNPKHLEPVSIGVSSLRGFGPSALNARQTHCKRGHELGKWNKGHRFCRICKLEWQRNRRPSLTSPVGVSCIS